MSSKDCSYPSQSNSRIAISAKPRSTVAQTEALCTFFEENPEVIRGYKKTPDRIDSVQAKWQKITLTLNTLGPPRDCKAWAKYLCNMKAKLKRKRVKWRQNSDGTGPIICNAEDFNEINLRMLQVLRKDISTEKDLNVYTDDTECWTKNPLEENNANVTEIEEPHRIDSNGFTEVSINVSDDDESSADMPPTYTHHDGDQTDIFGNVSQTHSNIGDEFDTFGKNIAQQLRSLPLAVALETQEMLLAVLRKQRLKVLNQGDSKNLSSSADPLFT